MEEKMQNLESRVSALETQAEKLPSAEIIKLAETSFKTVLDADIHLDNKASRILSAIAFLTAAAAAIFSRAYSPVQTAPELQQPLTQALSPYLKAAQLPSTVSNVLQNLEKPRMSLLGFDLALLSFSAYILFVLLGAALYLAALGPSLNIPGWLRDQSKNKQVKSLLFFENIASVDEDRWFNYWTENAPKDVQRRIKDNFIKETYLLAQKTKTKVRLMSVGSVCFKGAITSLAFLIVSLFSFAPSSGWLFLLISVLTLGVAFTFENIVRPKS